MDKKNQLSDLETAYQAFAQTAGDLTPEAFQASIGDWTPRDILAHFIGWNRITLTGCSEIKAGKEPFYFYDGTNDYRRVNACFFSVFPSWERDRLLEEMGSSKKDLLSFLERINEQEWDRDTGVVHYRGGPATVSRCVDSLIRDYRKHQEEILQGIQPK